MNTKTTNTNLPAIAGEGSLSGYLTRIKKFPMLSSEEEYMLAKSWRDRGDLKSAQKLVTSHLRLVAKIAMGYRGYGLPVSELVSEGNIGLMQAVKKFDPERGFTLATYAMWWIKASIQEYILRSWSLVKIGTTTAQKKLFFNLNKLKNKFTTAEDILITRERHRQNLINCVHHLEKFEKKKSAQDFDKAAEDLRLATRHLGMIVGKVDVEELLGSIFNDFCIGK
mgnify:CR=1 FL=1